MGEEGVIKFELEFSAAAPLAQAELADLIAWRRILHLLRLIGRDPGRYGGYGYGNLSRRLPPQEAPAPLRRFVISGTQTGGLPELLPAHFAVVSECRPTANLVVAQGPIRPSAEALTHGAIYAADPQIRFVMHVHSPDLWHSAERLGLPVIGENASYGSPEMAAEVKRLLTATAARQGIFAMGGHEDGIFVFGVSAEEAGSILLKSLAQAFEYQAKGVINGSS
ncbi:MAG: class II aldolase/adducin family protein [Desulfuromonadales bacterium]|nr:class II aldolase/adducin family protein [Desulfuromonadales bacterium]